VGGSITYQITVENTGEDTLNNIQVHDTILGDLSASFADTSPAAHRKRTPSNTR
jgi:uncharacterized repeat protein (TIGR01451 family)